MLVDVIDPVPEAVNVAPLPIVMVALILVPVPMESNVVPPPEL
jgi:hypothetical protein